MTQVASAPSRPYGPKLSESFDIQNEPDLVERVLAGEVIIARRAMQQIGLLDVMLEDCYAGLRKLLGEERVAQILQAGIEKIHDFVPPGEIPTVTDAIYAVAGERELDWLNIMMPKLIGDRAYYFEGPPNVRFHIPYAKQAEAQKAFEAFRKRHGEGKVTSHGPHRDSWLDCPDNGINIWMALGRVRRGNGLTIYLKEYKEQQTFTPTGEVTEDVQLSEPLAFDLEPGDFILFHTDHLHGSELNRTDETRFVISFRTIPGRPNFPRGHYHRYRHAGLANGPLKALAHIPAFIQPSYPRSLAERAIRKVFGRSAPPVGAPAVPEGPVLAEEIQTGEVRALDAATCVGRLESGKLVAFSRRCPHKGADLACGFISGERIVCPWHNLSFDPATGKPPCEGLRPLAVKEVEVVDGVVTTVARTRSRMAPA